MYSQVMRPEKSSLMQSLGLGPISSNLWDLISNHLGVISKDNRASKKVKLLEEDMKIMEHHHVNEMITMKENQARLQVELAIMKSVVDMHSFSEATMPLESNRITNE